MVIFCDAFGFLEPQYFPIVFDPLGNLTRAALMRLNSAPDSSGTQSIVEVSIDLLARWDGHFHTQVEVLP